MASLGWQQGWSNLRASDADRDETAAHLREHCAAGRLTLDELTERLDRVFSSRTLGELSSVMSDLPDLEGRSMAKQRPGVPVAPRHRRFVPILVALLAIWLVTRTIFVVGYHDRAYLWVLPIVVLLLVRRLSWSARPSRHSR